jgi:hypothetical protein
MIKELKESRYEDYVYFMYLYVDVNTPNNEEAPESELVSAVEDLGRCIADKIESITGESIWLLDYNWEFVNTDVKVFLDFNSDTADIELDIVDEDEILKSCFGESGKCTVYPTSISEFSRDYNY